LKVQYNFLRVTSDFKCDSKMYEDEQEGGTQGNFIKKS